MNTERQLAWSYLKIHIKICILICIFFISLFAFYSYIKADAPFEDIDIKLGIETGEGSFDFEDNDGTIDDLRIVSYKISITNNGDANHEDLVILMNTPEYLEYISDSTKIITLESETNLSDVGENSPIVAGYLLPDISSGESVSFTADFQVNTPDGSEDEELYTVAWANCWGKYSGIPVVSNLVENMIFGEAKPVMQINIASSVPEAGEPVYTGSSIQYYYTVRNVGGVTLQNATLTLFKPDYTTCDTEDGCGLYQLGTIEPGQSYDGEISMSVLVGEVPEGITEIVNIVTGENMETIKIVHPIDSEADIEGDFTVIINQVPNIILNSADGINSRADGADGADLTETQYSLLFAGKHKQYTYPTLSDSGQSKTTTPCGSYTHANKFNAYFYTYNSESYPIYDHNNSFGIPESLSTTNIQTAPIDFNVNTILPEASPKLIFTVNTPMYSYGTQSEVHNYMQNGGQIDIPSIFTESRAVHNGAMGIVESQVTSNVLENRWQYVYTGQEEYLCREPYSCGDKTCYKKRYRPIYTWQKVSSENIELRDDDSTNINVYTSTAWLKTQGGHIGTNDNFTNEAGMYGDLNINKVDLEFIENPYNQNDCDDGDCHWDNTYLKENHLTSSSEYTPPKSEEMPYGSYNAEYMIFGNTGVGDMKTSCGQDGESDCDDWYVTGTEFPFLQRGDVYDRENNPRNYDNIDDPENNPSDLLTREKFGEVRTSELPPFSAETVELGDDIIWNYGKADIYIGSEEDMDDVIIFSGGQSRIYTEGNVYINADIKYETSSSSNYNEITSVRIDARNIYVDGTVTDLEVMLLAREGFYSGVSKRQLRILGDVIAKNSYWQREPLLEFFDDDEEVEFNRPSEHIIEDMRKYIVPAPGDTEVPDDYTIWRQVNPATGEVLDAY